jgi:cephalosporin hydroxylase
MRERLPPTVRVDLHEPALRDYFRARAEQHTQDSYMGVPLSKFPEDLRVYEHLLWLDAPDTVIELGTQFGGSALWFRDRLTSLLAYGRITETPRVITVDLDLTPASEALASLDNSTGLTLIEGPLEDLAIVNHVAQLIGERCLVVEDSAHTYETTAAALRHYAPFVSPGGFMVIEDGCVDDDALRLDATWPRGVRPAIDDWLRTTQGQAFVARRDLELYGVSCHPSGFLQRVR